MGRLTDHEGPQLMGIPFVREVQEIVLFDIDLDEVFFPVLAGITSQYPLLSQ